MRLTKIRWRVLAAVMLWLVLLLAVVERGYAATPGVAIAEPGLALEAMRFEEPLVPSRPTSAGEDADLTAAIARYRTASAPDDVSALTTFVASHPQSGWRLAVLTNLGLAYYHNGYFSHAIEAFDAAWQEGKSATELHARALTDRAAGELLRMHARLGHADTLAGLLDQMQGRGLSGKATEWRDGAKEGLWAMRNDPGVAYLCGPMALKNLLLAGGATAAQVAFLDDYRSGPHGVTLAEVGRLAAQAKLSYRLIHRAPEEPVPVPAVVHWKVNHFAAIIGEHNGRYELADPTFGERHMWVTRAALDSEASGFYLVPNAQQSSKWRDATADEAAHVYGMGYTGSNDPSDTTPSDPPCTCFGMTRYSFTEMVVSLKLTDTPVGYVPPKGPPVPITISYQQREASQPANFGFFNVSAKWSLNWLSYVQDDPNNPGGNVDRVVGGGGYVAESGYNGASGTFAAEPDDASVLSRATSGQITYTRTLADGSVEVYGASNGATSYPRYVFLTQKIDPAGNALSLSYDASFRLTAVTDATGRATTFQYGNATFPLQVTGITDPFGRTATLAYNGAGQLASITDVIGISSSFAYDGSGLVNALTTPYGTTNFVYGDNGNSRYLQATDPLGYTERVEYVQGAPGIPFSDPGNLVPSGVIAPFNAYLSERDTFYWDKHVYAVAAGNYTQARNKHWAHLGTNTNYTSNTLESIKYPLENRIWYNYPGQPTGGLGAGQSGTLLKPTRIARVLSDGTSQNYARAYNNAGNPIFFADPVGRITNITYAANQTDVISVQQVTGNGPVTTASYTYNSQHLPLTATDAAGQTTQNTYNASGQITSITDALGETTTFNYNALGYLTSIVNANGQTALAVTYDAFSRVATRTDSQGWTTAYTYDALDRITRQTYPDGTSRSFTYNILDLVAVTDRQGRTTTFTHDADENLTSVTDPAGHTVQFTYYENGKPQSIIDPNGHAVAWTIDLQGRVTTKTDANGGVYSFAYDPATSRLASVTDPLGQIKQFTYSPDDRMASVQYPNAINPTASVYFADDPDFMRRVSMTDGNGTTTYSYNPPGAIGALQLAQETPPFANSTISYGYDALGRMITRSVGGDTETFARDKLGRLTSHTDDLGTFTRGYLGQTGQLASQTRGSIGTQFSYDTNTNDRRLTRIVNTPGASQFAYTSTPENDVTAITQTTNPQTWSYQYDQSDKLTSAKSSLGPTFSYGYDPSSNLASIAAPTGSTTIAPTASNAVAAAGATAFTYDANGNLLADYARSYKWDAENRLIGIAGVGYSSTFAYDGLGRRTAIATTSGGSTGQTNFGWCGQSLCQERTAANVPTRRYLAEGEYDSVQGALVYATDHLGSVRDVIAAPTGLRANHFDYDPYGNVTAATGSRATWTDFRYAGLFYHQPSGLYLASNRAYDPVIGHWLSRDPIGEEGGGNIYAYGFGNPLRFTDPLGFGGSGGGGSVCIPNWALAAAAVAAVALAPEVALAVAAAAIEAAAEGEAAAAIAGVAEAAVEADAAAAAEAAAVEAAGAAAEGSAAATGAEAAEAAEAAADAAGETYFRTMSASDFEALNATGQIPATSETFISPSLSYAQGYDGVTVEFSVNPGTTDALANIGVRDASNAVADAGYGDLPMVSPGWNQTSAFFKGEGGIVNIGLGQGPALDLFNGNILSFAPVP